MRNFLSYAEESTFTGNSMTRRDLYFLMKGDLTGEVYGKIDAIMTQKNGSSFILLMLQR